MTSVLVFGAAGRMGATVCGAVDADPELILAAGVDPGGAGQRDLTDTITIAGSTADIDPTTVDVAVDFTVAEAARQNLEWCADNGVHAVVGTSGFGDADFRHFADVFTSSNCLIAPNFAIGAVLMMRFAELAAPFFPTAEIIELHHDNKVDAPSGTAMGTLERMAAASDAWGADPTQHEVVEGARGGKGPGGITVHSVRLRGLVAHQQVLLGTEGETLTIRHDSMDRSSFMGGVVHACKVVDQHPGLTVGLDTYLGL
ncbi:MAG: 4-hydroxy-tetrahydrodipicolinate reductase [Actinomycetota bacterium]|jgi:4-hydroxy-tetrahydrodipicolinate reductase|nr:4-hydroxy-tetrahydrodipicolinate reductase [Actinomycetota bacterium]